MSLTPRTLRYRKAQIRQGADRKAPRLVTAATGQGLGAGAGAVSSAMESVNNLERRPVLDREDSALPDHDLVRRDLRRRLGGLHIGHRFGLGEHGN